MQGNLCLSFMDKHLTWRPMERKMPTNGNSGTTGEGRNWGGDSPVSSGFALIGASDRAGPLLLSVPHAGRDYPDRLKARSRVSEAELRRLEDRYADLLVADSIGRGHRAIVARLARAAIDLNRDPRDIDRRVVANVPRDWPLVQSVKQRGGLGLFPRSLPRAGDLWRSPMEWEEARSLISGFHQTYHRMIVDELDAIQAHGGEALLVDIHSMPPVWAGQGAGARPDIVIGDRFGASAAPRFSELARSIAVNHGFVVALNHPYPGSYLIERHGQPRNGRHALQMEISRDLYLDGTLEEPGPGLPRVRRMLAALTEQLAAEVIRRGTPLAAE
ncbi:MAG: N-formylglutamate amidohydrolase [Sphingobium sp.]